MGAKVVKLKDVTTPKKAHGPQKISRYLENPDTQYLFTGTDERGRTVYFFKMCITGLYDRAFGPYASRSIAIHAFDDVLIAALESFCDVHSPISREKGNNGMEHIAFPANLTPVSMR